MGMDGNMIADMMNIVPLRVWVFWLFVTQAIILWLGYKAYSILRKDNVKLARMIIGDKNESV